MYNNVMLTVQCSTINSYIAVIYFLIRINIHIKGTSFYALWQYVVYRRSPAKCRTPCIREQLVEWVYKRWLLIGLGYKIIDNKIQLLPIHIIFKQRLVNEGGLNIRVVYPMSFFSRQK